jgi:radical SAM/Cys-rich protein
MPSLSQTLSQTSSQTSSQTPSQTPSQRLSTAIPFSQRLDAPLQKQPIGVLQINLGKRCNLACSHCHVEAGPNRTEEISAEVCDQVIALIQRFPQIQTVDLTGGAPEMFAGFKPIVAAARQAQKQVMVRSNLTIYFEPGFEDIPAYCAEHQARIVASLPCYLADNVDKMRGHGVYDASIRALQWLNRLGYGEDPQLGLDLVYNPPIPTSPQFSLTPDQGQLQRDYADFLLKNFEIKFDRLLAITNLPIGRTANTLHQRQLYDPYVDFLATHFNPETLGGVMCRNQLSVDYLGRVYDCDFNQMAELPAKTATGEILTVASLLAAGSLDLIGSIQTADYCYGCTAGSGSSCGGTLV